MNNYCIYWYHYPEHTDPFTEGYIGMTKNLDKRKESHSYATKAGKNLHFYNAARKYGEDNLICEVLHKELSELEAREHEEMYRPEPNIAWNMAVGGNPVFCERKRIVTIFHESDKDKEYTYGSLAECAEKHNLNRARISQALIRKTNVFGLDGWHVVHENTNKDTILTYSEMKSKQLKGLKRTKPNIWKGRTDRWSEEDKTRIGNQHRGKKLSKEQVLKLKEHNRLHNPSCKTITLKHKDNDEIFTYHSISEASRQLNIPLSRLKSKALRPLQKYGKDGWAIMSLGN